MRVDCVRTFRYISTFFFYQVLHVGARWDGKDRQMLGSEVAEKLSKQKEWIGKQKVA